MVKLIKSTFYNEEDTKKKLAEFVLRAEKLSFGEECEKFEKDFAQFQGKKHCVLVNSGSSANFVLIQSLVNMGALKTGDKVGFSAITWSTNVMPLIQLGLKPVPIDVELDTLNISSKTLQKVLNDTDLKAVFITDLLGFCDDIDNIRDICEKKGVLLLEDNCESLGTVYKGVKLGNFGLAGTYSFYVGHHMSTIEGGAICTDSEELATIARMVRAHGWDRNLPKAGQKSLREKYHVSDFYAQFTFYDLGGNFRPTEIQGFLGNVQLQYLPEIIQKRKNNFSELASAIYSDKDRYHEIKFSHIELLSNFAFPIVCKTREIRDALVKKCEKQIEVRPIVGGAMTEQPFFKKYVTEKFSLPNATLIHEQGLYVGNNPELTPEEINQIIDVFTSK